MNFVPMVTDITYNNTKLGKLVEEKFVSTVPHYCADNNLQLPHRRPIAEILLQDWEA